MGIDRTSELVEILKNQDGVKSSQLVEKRPIQGLRNRHKRERFALEDQKSPSLANNILSDSDMEGVITPPRTFAGRATSVLMDIQQAERLIIAAKGKIEIQTGAIQQILDLCLQHIKLLQDLAEELSTVRKSEEGWLAGWTTSSSSTLTQIDQHEAGIVWFLNHKLSMLNQEYENAKDEEEQRARKHRQLKAIGVGSVKSIPLSSTFQETTNTVLPITTEELKERYKVSDQQMQELVTENDNLLREYTEMQSALVTTQTSIQEISRLQITLQEQLVYQATQIDRLFDDSMTTTETVRKANVQLSHAASHMSRSVRFFIITVLFAAFFLLLLHFLAD